MKHIYKDTEIDDYVYRLIQKSDADKYYEDNMRKLDSEVAYYTGSKSGFGKDEVIRYVHQSVDSNESYFFVLVDEDKIVGECVINEIDYETKRGGLRIAILRKDLFSKGLGSKMMKESLKFAFHTIGLDEIELEVFHINIRGMATYKKLGFKEVEVIKDELQQNGEIVDVHVMILKKEDYLD